MGGRYCSLAVGDPKEPLPALGLLLLGYPLHPAGKADPARWTSSAAVESEKRAEHFPRLTLPVLVREW